MWRGDFDLSCSNVADWWNGFNAPDLRRGCSVDWLNGFKVARAVECQLDLKANSGREPYDPDLCVNCFDLIPYRRRSSALTCCTACQQIAEGVRGLRRWVTDPSQVLESVP
jgi:hypothetical protein